MSLKEEIEKQMDAGMPAMLKPLSACMGPVKTLEAFMCAVPADKQDQLKSAIEKYKGL